MVVIFVELCGNIKITRELRLWKVAICFGVSESNVAPYRIVSNVQTKAVKAKYGSVGSSYEYKLKTTQHVVETEHQTQEQITVSAQAICYGRR